MTDPTVPLYASDQSILRSPIRIPMNPAGSREYKSDNHVKSKLHFQCGNVHLSMELFHGQLYQVERIKIKLVVKLKCFSEHSSQKRADRAFSAELD